MRLVVNGARMLRVNIHQDEGLGGIEVLITAAGVLVFGVTMLTSLLRFGLTKLALEQIAAQTARTTALSLNQATIGRNIPQTQVTYDRFGDRITLSGVGSLQSCSLVTFTASTSLPLLPWRLFGGGGRVIVSATSTVPTSAYHVGGGGGLNCNY